MINPSHVHLNSKFCIICYVFVGANDYIEIDNAMEPPTSNRFKVNLFYGIFIFFFFISSICYYCINI